MLTATPQAPVPAGDADAGDCPGRTPAVLADVARGADANATVVGLPRAMSGGDAAGAASARRVAAALEQATDARVVVWDERLSSVEAERVLLGAGRRRAQRRTERDRVAAAIILQAWLQANAASPS